MAELGDDLWEGMEIVAYQPSQVLTLHPAWCGLLAEVNVQPFGEVAQLERDFAEKEVVPAGGQHTAGADVLLKNAGDPVRVVTAETHPGTADLQGGTLSSNASSPARPRLP